MNSNLRNRKNGQHGQSLVELALLVPVILILFTGVVDTSRALYTQISLRDAAQEGANYAAYAPGDTTGIQARARQTSTFPVDLTDTANVTVTTLPNCTLGNVKVTVKILSFQFWTPGANLLFGAQQIPMQASVTNPNFTCP